MIQIPFNQPYRSGLEERYVADAIKTGALSGDGQYTKKVQVELSKRIEVQSAFLTHSATAALEMAAILCDLKSGDEVLMPSYTFVSTANAFALRGAIPVFIDIRPDTLNINEDLLEDAITPRTKAIVAVHYAGVGCEMNIIMNIAKKYNLRVIEDAAQGIGASYLGKPLGSIGDMAAISFHATKNINCGEGGVFLTQSNIISERAEIIREKGTNRSKFYRGQIDKYSWVDLGSSFLPSEMNAAYLMAQLEVLDDITSARLKIWDSYQEAFQELEDKGFLRRPTIPKECQHNGHIYFILMPDIASRDRFIKFMNLRGVSTTFHYVPLHSAAFSKGMSRVGSPMNNSIELADRIVRLPIWPGMEGSLDYIIESVRQFFSKTVNAK